MADNDFPQRPHRASQPPVRNAPATAPQSTASSDPLAELARLIGQTDPFAEYGRDSTRNAATSSGSAPAHAHEAAGAPTFGDSRFAAAQPAPPQFGAPPFAEPPYSADAYAQGPVPGYGPEGGHSDFEQDSYYPNIPHDVAEGEQFYDEVQPRRRAGILAAAAVFALVVIGVASAFGYRALFAASAPSGPPPVIKADTAPSKIVPAQSKDAKSGKLIYDRVASGPQDEKLVSREEQPIDIAKDRPVSAVYPPGNGGPSNGTIEPTVMGNGVVGGVEPKKIHTIAIHPDQITSGTTAPSAAPAPKPPAPAQSSPKPPTQVAQASPPPPQPQQRVARAEPSAQHAAAAANAPLSLTPNASAPAPARTPQGARPAPAPAQSGQLTTTAAAPAAAAASGGYAVQVASRRSEADAQASLHSLQAKYPQQLGNQPPLIRRVDLGAKGVYYRAMVGPFESSEQASQVCSNLKAAGGDCLIQKI